MSRPVCHDARTMRLFSIAFLIFLLPFNDSSGQSSVLDYSYFKRISTYNINLDVTTSDGAVLNEESKGTILQFADTNGVLHIFCASLSGCEMDISVGQEPMKFKTSGGSLHAHGIEEISVVSVNTNLDLNDFNKSSTTVYGAMVFLNPAVNGEIFHNQISGDTHLLLPDMDWNIEFHADTLDAQTLAHYNIREGGQAKIQITDGQLSLTERIVSVMQP